MTAQAKRFGLTAALMGALLLQPHAFVAAQAAEPEAYRAAVDEAVEEYAAGHFEEARALFGQAHQLSPNARTLRGLGMTEFELRNYTASVGFLEQALASKVKPLEGDLRGETERLLARANAFVGRYTLDLQPNDARLLVDGERPLFDPNGALLLAVGNRAIEASAPGRAGERRSVQVKGGERETLRISLPLQAAVAPPASVPARSPRRDADPEADDGSVFESPWFWVAVSAVVVGAGVGVGIATLGGETRDATPYGGDADVVLDGP